MCYNCFMIRLIIWIAIFYAGYQIGMHGFDEFASSIDIEEFTDSFSDVIASIEDIVEKVKG